METFTGTGRLLTSTGSELATVSYEYQIDRTHRVWKGVARRTDAPGERLPVPAGPAVLETTSGEQAMVNYYHRATEKEALIVFTGRGAPPGG